MTPREVGPPSDIEKIAGDGHRARHSFYDDVPNHSHRKQPRHTKPMGFIKYPTGQKRSCDIADSGYQTKNCLNSESDICARDEKRNIEKR